MSSLFKGVLIDQSVAEPEKILHRATVVSTIETLLEGEDFRGKVLFHNIEVQEDNLWAILDEVAKTIKSPGWYFHLVSGDRLYIAMPNAVFIAKKNDSDLKNIIEYASSHGIHPEQLNLKQLFDNPFA